MTFCFFKYHFVEVCSLGRLCFAWRACFTRNTKKVQHTVPGMLLRHVFAASRFARRVSTTTAPKTAVIMLNMGGPSSLTGPKDGVTTFLTNLFTDPEIIPLGPLQTFLVRRTAPLWAV